MYNAFRIMAILSVASVAGAKRAESPVTRPHAAATRPIKAEITPEVMIRSMGEDYRPCVERCSGGKIDWTRGEILATGVGRVHGSGREAVAMARRAGRLIAARNAILIISRIRVDPDGTFPDISGGRITLESVLRDFEELPGEHDPDARTVTVTLRVPLYGTNSLVKMTGIVTHQRASRWSFPDDTSGKTSNAQSPDVIVIDARETQFVPGLFPRLQTPTGRYVLEGGDVPRDELLRRPLVAYATKPIPAPRSATRSTSRPVPRILTLRAAKSAGRSNSALVLDDEQLEKLTAHPEAKSLLRSGRIVVIVPEIR